MAAPQQAGNQGDNSTSILWITAAIFAVIGVIWFMFRDAIIYYFLHLKLLEIDFLALFNEAYFAPIKAQVHAALPRISTLTFNDLLSIGTNVGDILRYPLLVILIICAFVVYFSNNARMYRHTYSMRTLSKLEKDNWPQIVPVVNLDLVKTDIDKGPWAMSLSPMQFCKKYKLLEEVRKERREGTTRKEWHKVDVALKRGEANKVFAMQLGPMWRGVHKLPPHTRALFAVFAARINADSKAANSLLLQLAATSQQKLNITGTDELLKKHLNSKLVQQVVASHAYVSTVMASMLERARDDGVQASADFLWLKALDRRLWYTLNTVGRQTPFPEVAGIFAHWVAEKEMGRKLLMPMVEEATKALELALQDIIYVPDEV